MQPLSRDWVERIHTRLLVRYGAAWIRMYEGIDPEAVAADWSEELAGIGGAGIDHALKYLPVDRPPNAAQFRALCIARPEPVPKAIAGPKPNPQRVAAIVGNLKTKLVANSPQTYMAALRARKAAGEGLTAAQRAFLAEATPQARQDFSGPINVIPDDALSSGMRERGDNEAAA